MTDRRWRRRDAPDPAPGPGGAPTAIALSPILSARYRSRDLERIRAAAPGRPARDGLGRGPRRRPARRRRGHAPRLAQLRRVRPAPGPRAAALLGPLGDVGRRAGPDAGRARARPGRDQRPRRVQPPDRRVRADDDPGGQPPAAAAPRAAARADVAAARGRRAARRDRRDRRARARSGGRSARSRPRSAAGSWRSAAGPTADGPAAAEGGRTTSGRPFGELHARPRRRPGDAARAARPSPTSSSSRRR